MKPKAHMLPVLTDEDIARRVKRLGEDISREYAGKELILVGVLKGAFMFVADLARALSIPAKVDFVRLASYADKDHGGEVRFMMDMELDCAGKHLLLVEDIVDTGRSMQHLLAALAGRGAASIKLCALVDKAERREVEVLVDFYGFRLAKGFVVGYGLDFAEDYRCLSGIFEIVAPKDD